MNTALIYKLFKSRETARNPSVNSNYDKDRRIAFSIIIINLIQLGVEFPLFLYLTHGLFVKGQRGEKLNSISAFTFFSLTFLNFLDYGSLPLINFLMNTIYRNQVKKMFSFHTNTNRRAERVVIKYSRRSIATQTKIKARSLKKAIVE